MTFLESALRNQKGSISMQLSGVELRSSMEAQLPSNLVNSVEAVFYSYHRNCKMKKQQAGDISNGQKI